MKEHKTLATPEKQIKHEICAGVVAEHDSMFSFLAWKMFKEHGRGYLYLQINVDVEHEKGNEFKVSKNEIFEEVIYFAKNSQLFKETRKSEKAAGQDKEWEPFYELVNTYQPRNEYLIVIGCQSSTGATEHWFPREPEIPPYKARATKI